MIADQKTMQRQIALLTQMIADQKTMYAQEIRRLNSKLQEMWTGEAAMYFSTPPSSPDAPPASPDPPPPSPIKM